MADWIGGKKKFKNFFIVIFLKPNFNFEEKFKKKIFYRYFFKTKSPQFILNNSKSEIDQLIYGNLVPFASK